MRFFLIGLMISILMPTAGYASVARLVADTQSGLILSAENDLELKYPASLTKVMTLYLTFWALENKLMTMQDRLPISEHAAAQPRSKLYLKAGGTMSVYEAIMALIIKSANDAAVVLAEALAPSEPEFAEIMTQTARQLGLRDTIFKNASGLHHKEQVTTARDMAVMTIALINHYPQYYALFSTPFFDYNGRRYYSHNDVLREYEGAEGLKTGFISAGGYSIISTAKKGDARLVTVVLGQDSVRSRNKEAIRMLDVGFERISHPEDYFTKAGQGNPLERQALIPQVHLEERFEAVQKHLDETRRLADLCLQNEQKNKAREPVLVQNKSDIAQGDSSWGIQVGAFAKEKTALNTAHKALTFLKAEGKKIKTPRFEQFFRSRIFGFVSSKEASNACRQLKNKNIQCFPVGPDY